MQPHQAHTCRTRYPALPDSYIEQSAPASSGPHHSEAMPIEAAPPARRFGSPQSRAVDKTPLTCAHLLRTPLVPSWRALWLAQLGMRLARYTRLRFGGRQPLCGMGVTSRIAFTSNPAAAKARIADSRPEPGPLTRTSR